LYYNSEIENFSIDEKLIFLLIGSSIEKHDFALKNHIETNSVDWEKIILFCSEHGLTSILYKYLKSRNITNLIDNVNLEKIKSYYYYTLKNTVVKQEYFNKIQKVFSESHIEILPLKGSYLINNHYDDVGLRPMSDIDILIEENNLLKAKQILYNLGYTLIPARTSIEEKYGLQYNLQFSKKDSFIELHRNITPPYSNYNLNIDEFWKRKDKSNLSIENHIIHFCVHYNFNVNNRLVRLGWFYDIISVISKNETVIDWKYISEFCIKNNLINAVNPILKFLNKNYNINIPINLKAINSEEYEKRFNHNFSCVLKKENSKMIVEKNLNYSLKLKLITKWIDKIRYLFQLIFPQKKYMVYKHKKFIINGYIKELMSVFQKIN